MQFLACFLQNVLSFTYIYRLQILLADYFKDLATPTSMPEFDNAFLQQAENGSVALVRRSISPKVR